jgi:hypothetical protein
MQLLIQDHVPEGHKLYRKQNDAQLSSPPKNRKAIFGGRWVGFQHHFYKAEVPLGHWLVSYFTHIMLYFKLTIDKKALKIKHAFHGNCFY